MTFPGTMSMKQMLACSLFCLALAGAAAGQMPNYGVTVTAEKNVDFAKFKTYTWTPGQPSPLKTLDTQIVAAVDSELQALGMTKATSGTGDVLVTYYSVSRTDVDLKAKPDAQGVRPQYAVGTLAVALLEPANRRQLLRLRADTPIEGDTSKLEPTIKAVVTAMFAKYPTRQK
jgi:hypothetical protein